MTTRPAPLRTARGRVAVAAAAFALAAGTSACQVASPITTDLSYDPADGVSVDVGDVAVRDLLVVSEGNGAPGAVSGLVVNGGTEEVTVTLQTDVPLTPEVTVPPGGSVRLDGQDPAAGESGEGLTLPAVENAPGTSITVRVSTSAGDVNSALVPVLTPEGPYSGLVDTDASTSTG